MVNIDYGQAFIELIRGSAATRGQLPKVIAAYNAGPVPVQRWAYYDRGDPLLWIESIPYWETRFYVPVGPAQHVGHPGPEGRTDADADLPGPAQMARLSFQAR